MLEFEPEVEDSVGHFVSGELLEVQLVSLDHVLGAAAGPVQKGSEKETKMNYIVLSHGRYLFTHQKESLFNVQWWYVTKLKIQSKKIVLMAALILLGCLVLSL